MKKTLAAVLGVVMLFALTTPAFAKTHHKKHHNKHHHHKVVKHHR